MILISILLMFFGLYGDSRPEYIKLSNNISSKFIKDVKCERNSSSIEEARILYVRLTEKLLNLYNQNTEVRQYLDVFPFEPKNIQILLIFKEIKNSSDVQLVSSTGKIENDMYYVLYSPLNGEENGQFEENYFDAYKIVYGHERPK